MLYSECVSQSVGQPVSQSVRVVKFFHLNVQANSSVNYKGVCVHACVGVCVRGGGRSTLRVAPVSPEISLGWWWAEHTSLLQQAGSGATESPARHMSS
jgi:hypothetical protein